MNASLLVCFLACFAAIASPRQRILVATDIWPPTFTQRSGDGLYQEILSTVYPGYNIAYVYTSYARSKNLVLSGKADLWLASYENEEAEALYPRLPYDADILTLVRLPSTPWQQLQDLDNNHIAWIQAYNLNKYLPQFNLQFYEVASIEDGLRMLLAGRIAYYLDDRWNVNTYLQQYPHIAAQTEFNDLALLPLYPGFVNNAKGKALIRQWDKALTHLQHSGQLEAIYRRFKADYVATACHQEKQPGGNPQWSGLPCLTLSPSGSKTAR